ncbi:ATP-binding protein [Eilatimonas milleporae]|uniref:histidine kinase n=1 Tax=Eilatimonas milleporae TaxID=911205 RepID=A0A3M0C6Z3_9PROT|nr:ATP-binding protein [Eilatimonas milleporae]RMB04457.1 two-component system cell cycle sensor histidine kinase PleC [Eilatimonas milleporae]
MTKVDIVATLVPPVLPQDLCAKVYDRFTDDAGLVAIPVVENGRPVGLMRRADFLVKLADRYGRPLFERRPVTTLMDAAPLLVETQTSIEDLNTLLVTEQQAAIQHGFIVVDNGIYKGIGTAYTLLQANMEKAQERMQALERAQLEAEAANRAKSNFLANMSHELRTPLNAIIGFSEFIIEGMKKGTDMTEHMGYVGDIRDSGQHLLNVINSILDMSKLEANAFELREDYEDPVIIAEQAVRIIAGQAKTHDVTVVLEGDETLCDLFADLQVVRQILLNLLSNAVKFSPAGGKVRLVLGGTEDGGIQFRVIDKGPGMSETDLARVMQPFVQADGAFARRHEGTGLGLPLVNAFAEAHGGSFRLESALGVGTTAIVTFPPSRSFSRKGAPLVAL